MHFQLSSPKPCWLALKAIVLPLRYFRYLVLNEDYLNFQQNRTEDKSQIWSRLEQENCCLGLASSLDWGLPGWTLDQTHCKPGCGSSSHWPIGWSFSPPNMSHSQNGSQSHCQSPGPVVQWSCCTGWGSRAASQQGLWRFWSRHRHRLGGSL